MNDRRHFLSGNSFFIVNEGMNQLKDGKVVRYLYNYPKNNGYGLFFESENACYMLNRMISNFE